jgi:hypothetical protein
MIRPAHRSLFDAYLGIYPSSAPADMVANWFVDMTLVEVIAPASACWRENMLISHLLMLSYFKLSLMISGHGPQLGAA